MSIDYEKGYCSCFGCGWSGDAYDFVKCINPKMNDLRAMRELVRILNSKKVKHLKMAKNHKKVKTSKQSLIEAHDYYYGLSKINWLVDNSDEVVSAREYMEKRGFKATTLNHCGCKVTYNKSYGIVFPLLDNYKFKGWVCRTMQPGIEKKRKYLYNDGFSRTSTLCGTYGRCKYVYIVEGYMDMLKLKQFGVKDVSAILGWKISDIQVQKLKDAGVTHVISALDNDECGKKGSEYLKNFFKVTRFKYLKGVKDPGEMTKEQFTKMNNRTLNNIK